MNTLQMIQKLFAHPCTFEDAMFEELHHTTEQDVITQDRFGDIWLLKDGDLDNGQVLLYNKELGMARRIKPNNMENFKGTKGKWDILKGSSLIGIFYKTRQLALVQGLDKEANALLISKAPELLNKLQSLLPLLEKYEEIKTYQEVETLINQATEI